MSDTTTVRIGPGPDEVRVTVNTDGTIALHDRYGRGEIVVDFADYAAHVDFVAEVVAALQWRRDHDEARAKAEQIRARDAVPAEPVNFFSLMADAHRDAAEIEAVAS